MKYFVTTLIVVIGGLIFFQFGKSVWQPIYLDLTQKQKLKSVLSEARANDQRSLSDLISLTGNVFPPSSITLLVMKEEMTMELWVNDGDYRHSFIKRYPVLAASGKLGPKLREGDKQVPEGVYKVLWLNPNSAYHLSMKLNFPNDFDMRYAVEEDRGDNPGSDIFIHGKAVSIGCVAIGDEAIEELYALAEQMKDLDIEVVIAPRDPRENRLDPAGQAYWVEDLYRDITKEFSKYERAL